MKSLRIRSPRAKVEKAYPESVTLVLPNAVVDAMQFESEGGLPKEEAGVLLGQIDATGRTVITAMTGTATGTATVGAVLSSESAAGADHRTAADARPSSGWTGRSTFAVEAIGTPATSASALRPAQGCYGAGRVIRDATRITARQLIRRNDSSTRTGHLGQ
jgi:hypothetical protein